MSGRLGLQGALNRQSVFDDLPCDAGTNSASAAKYERQLKAMKEENSRLRTELQETRATLEMLVKQKSHESFDERRVNLLKCQLFQQERQILLLNEALGSRSATLMEVENALSWLADTFRSHIADEVKGASVPVSRAELMRMVETAESARIKLFKNVQNTSHEDLRKPMMFMNEFLRPDLQEDFSLLDVVSGKLEHLNLKHVGQLESELCSLYKELVRLHELLASVGEGKGSKSYLPSPASAHMSKVVRERLDTQLLRACALTRRGADRLLDLSLLYPSAPWPALRRPVQKDISADQILAALPQLSRSKTQDVTRLVSAVLKVCSYRRHLLQTETQALREEVKFHQSVYDLQLDYVTSLLDSVRAGYHAFEKSASEVISKPLAAVLESYQGLKTTAGEDALRTFLSTFKQYEHQLGEVVDRLSRPDGGKRQDLDSDSYSDSESEHSPRDKTAALTAFGEDFLRSLSSMVYEQQQKRDAAGRNRQDLRAEQERIEAELRDLIGQLEEEHERVGQTENNSVSTARDKSGTPSSSSSLGNRDSQVGQERGEMVDKDQRDIETEEGTSVGRHGKAREKRHNTSLGIRQSKSDFGLGRTDDLSPEKDDSCENEKSEKSEESVRPDTSRTRTSSVKAKFSKPPAGGSPSVVKPSYKPNLVVPNRTLQLRRSGSLTRLSSRSASEERATGHMPASQSGGKSTGTTSSQSGVESTGTTYSDQDRRDHRRKADLPKVSKLPKKAPFK